MGSGNFWESMNEGFNRGVPLGIHIAEQGREEARLKRAEEREKEAHDLRMRLGNIQTESAQLELDERKRKAQHSKIQTGVASMIGLRDAAKKTGNQALEDDAIKIGEELYRNLYPDGNDVMIFRRDWDPNNKIWEGQDKSTKYMCITGREGGAVQKTPLKSIDEFVALFEPYLDYETYSKDMKALAKERREFNAAAMQKPFTGKDGKNYVWQKDDNGKVTQVEFTGQMAESAIEQKRREIEETKKKRKGGKLTPEDNIILGLSKPGNAAEERYHNAQAAKLEQEVRDAKAGGGKNALETAIKRRKYYSDTLNDLLKPFGTKGKRTVDIETGEMTQVGDNALREAGKLLDKDPSTLNTEEKRLLPFAKRAWFFYEEMSGGPDPRTAAERKAKELGLKQDANGRWYDPTSTQR